MSKVGRPLIYIDWDEVYKLVSYQCTQVEIAHFFNCSVDTLDRRAREELGISFAEIWARKISLGKIRLRKAAFDHIERGTPGWSTVFNRIDDKLHIFPQNTPPEIEGNPTRDVTAIGSGLKTFAEFCATSGYFLPYPKQEEMRAFGMDETETRLMLGARGYGKTDFVTIMGVAYDLYCGSKSGQDLDLFTNLIITKSKARNGAIVEEIAAALLKNGVELDTANKSVIRLKGLIGQDHSVEAITIKSSMRGRHPKRIVMDDPVTDEDTSAKMREVVEKRYNEAYKLCSNIVIIGQPAHFDDLFAKLRNIIKTMLVPHGSIPELDADLAAMEAAGIDKTSIEMSYHLRVPEAGSAIFGKIKRLLEPFGSSPSVAFLDPSDGGDYTALTIARGFMDSVQVKGHAWKKAYYLCYDELVTALKSAGVIRLVFETNKHGEGPLIQLRELLEPHGIGVVGYTSTGDKHARIELAGSYAHMIHLSNESDKTYTDQVTKYEKGAKYDDAPDSLSAILIWLGLLKKKR